MLLWVDLVRRITKWCEPNTNNDAKFDSKSIKSEQMDDVDKF